MRHLDAMLTNKLTMKIINNLEDYLEMLSAETPYQAGRNLYKYTDCGPWTVFITETEKAFKRTVTLAIGKVSHNKLGIVNVEEDYDPRNAVTDNDRIMLGLLPPKSEWRCSLKKYRKLVEKYQSRWNNGYSLKTHLHGDVFDRRFVWLTISQEMPAVQKDIYYESHPANSALENCIGVRIGTIVEGSEVELGGDALLFPFTDVDFDQQIESLNSEATFYWKRDNVSSYSVIFKDTEYYVDLIHYESFKELPKSIRKKVYDFVQTSAMGDAEYNIIPVPGTKASVQLLDKSDFFF